MTISLFSKWNCDSFWTERVCLFRPPSAHSSWKRALALLAEWPTEWTGGQNNTSRRWGAKRWSSLLEWCCWVKAEPGKWGITPASCHHPLGLENPAAETSSGQPHSWDPGCSQSISPAAGRGVSAWVGDHALIMSRLHWAALAATKQAAWAGGSGTWHGPDRNLWAGSAVWCLTLPQIDSFVRSFIRSASCRMPDAPLHWDPWGWCHCHAIQAVLSNTADVSNWSVAGLNWDMR